MVGLASAVLLALGLASRPAQADAPPAELGGQPELAAAASSNYETGAHQAAKGKKIQIVYIKVPLAKLKPSLGSPDDNSTRSKGAHYDASK